MADGNNFNRNNNPPKERAKHSLNDFRFRLVGQRLDGATKPCNLGFDIGRDGIEFTANTNVEGDKDYGRIRFSVSLQDAFFIMTVLERAPRLQAGKHETIAIAGAVWDRQSNSRKVRMQANMKIGRNDAGVIYIAVSSWETSRPTVMIEMLPSNLVKLVDPEGNPAPADKVSELMAVAWAKSLSEMLPMVLNQEYARVNADFLAKQSQGRPGGQQGGGGGQQQSGGGGYTAPASGGNQGYGGGFDGDDLPM